MPIKSQSLLSKYQQIQLLLLLGRERLKKAPKNYQTSLQQEHQKYMLHSCSSFASAMYGSILGKIISLLYSLLCLHAPMDHISSFCHRSDRNLLRYEVILSRFLTSRKSFTPSKYWQHFVQKCTLYTTNSHLISDSIHNCNLYQLNFLSLESFASKDFIST